MLVNKQIDIRDIAVDLDGNLIATVTSPIAPSPDAFLVNSCRYGSYVKFNPAGELLFASYLPFGLYYDFEGVTPRGAPMLRRVPLLDRGEEYFEVVEDQPAAVFVGCLLDSAGFLEGLVTSPGALVTLFGAQLGPREGVAFELVDGRLPTSLGGTRVLVNGEAVPLLYATYGQVNVLMPYTLPLGTHPEIQVISNGSSGNVYSLPVVIRSAVSIFRVNDTTLALALNEDGTVNSMRNPARPGSRVVLFGTGGGQTNPAGTSGEITPLELRPIIARRNVSANDSRATLPVEYAGAAPGLLAGVIQINVKLPESILDAPGVPPGTLRLSVETQDASSPGPVYIFVRQ